MLPEPINRPLGFLVQRAHLLSQVRSFFAERGYLELDTPLLSRRSSIDAHIDLIQAHSHGDIAYLISSPEYAMKRLLAEGFPNAYQISHVFRAGECSDRHNPEFCMIEWYRLDNNMLSAEDNFENLIQETLDLILMAIPTPKSIKRHNYWDLFSHYLGLDLKNWVQQAQEVACAKLQCWLRKQDPHAHIPLSSSDCLDDWLSYTISYYLEPKLEKDCLHVVQHFPASQAALATTSKIDGLEVARRFEIYFGSLELANGYHELTQPFEQQRRLELAQQDRLRLGKDPLIIDERFIDCLHHLPACCGVAVGFDRLLMKRVGASSIKQVLPFSWEDA